ncbi:DUF6625 family protein [Calothrix rhizosoleniae]|uniref:DUF6625 family protein n=1 Tax=Calothrix rhizosoleniae TaxID=888997 RepID=UPI000B4970E8|nr:DUF6625 family protein [Calothrix rhizosoleniae]
MKKIALIIAYFGQWPTWFPAFLESCKYNSGIDWIVFTDCEIPDVSLNNVKFVPFTIEDFNLLASQKLGFEVNLPFVYKMCDFKPTYGVVFEDYIKDYDFWGHCDLDIVWGDIRKFINDEILSQYEIVSAGKETISGHFCLYLNNNKINQLFTKCLYYQAQLLSSEHTCFDESAMTNLVKSLSQRGEVSVFWPQWLVNYPNLYKPMLAARLGLHTNRWRWDSGKLYNQNQEVMYMHFMTWKKSLTNCYLNYQNSPKSFYISYSHIGLTKSDKPPLAAQFSSLLALTKTLLTFDYNVWHRRINYYIIDKIWQQLKQSSKAQSDYLHSPKIIDV